VDLDEHSDATPGVKVGADQPFAGHAPRLLRRGGQALLAEPSNGLLQVALRLGKSLLAVHEARTGLVAKLLDGFGSHLHQFASPPSSRSSSSSLPRLRSSARPLPSSTASAIAAVNSLMARIASSLPGIFQSIRSGSQFVSTTATTGMDSRFASRTAISSFFGSITNIASGRRFMFLMPPIAASSLSRSRRMPSISFLVSASAILGSSRISSRRFRRSIDALIVWKLVSMPPSQRLFT